MISESSIITQTKEQVYSQIDGESVILNLKSGEYYGLNSVGARIWELIQEPKAVNEVQNLILAEYEVELEQCQNDRVALLQELAEAKLIDITDEKAA